MLRVLNLQGRRLDGAAIAASEKLFNSQQKPSKIFNIVFSNCPPHVAVRASVRTLPRVPASVLLEVAGVPELPAAVLARESRLVGVDEHVVVERVLTREHRLAHSALVGTDAWAGEREAGLRSGDGLGKMLYCNMDYDRSHGVPWHLEFNYRIVSLPIVLIASPIFPI